jgi:hypothetical protein
VKRSHLMFALLFKVRSRPIFESHRTPRPRCSPMRPAHRRQPRGPISNRAETSPVTTAEKAPGATLFVPRKHQTESARHHDPEGRQHRDQPWPIVRHTRSPRDCLVSFGIVFGAGLPRPPRLTCQTQQEAHARVSPNIVWTSFWERSAKFEPIETNDAPSFPFRNSTFKRAWISRLMYQKTLRGQLAVDIADVGPARSGRPREFRLQKPITNRTIG